MTNPDNPKHQRQSQIIVPMDTPGIKIEKMMHVFGYDDAPHGHGRVSFKDVRVPKENLLLGEGGALKSPKEDWVQEEFIIV